MKNLTLTSLFIFLISLLGYSQDTIRLNKGKDIEAKVIEVLPNEVKYKRYSNLDGPIYTINQSNIYMIIYENGDRDYFTQSDNNASNSNPINNSKKLDISSGFYQGNNKISRKEFKEILSTNQKAYSQFKAANAMKILGIAVAIPSAGLLGWTLGSGDYDVGLIVSGSLVFASGFAVIISGYSLTKKSLRTYNSGLNLTSYEFKISSNGIGIALNF